MMMSKLISSVHLSTYCLSPPPSWKPPHLTEAQGTDATLGFPSKHLPLSLPAAAAYTINSQQSILFWSTLFCMYSLSLSLSHTHTHTHTCVVNRLAYCLINPHHSFRDHLPHFFCLFVLPHISCILSYFNHLGFERIIPQIHFMLAIGRKERSIILL